jgi:hypothetical protein
MAAAGKETDLTGFDPMTTYVRAQYATTELTHNVQCC